jgi:hypothetical protein
MRWIWNIRWNGYASPEVAVCALVIYVRLRHRCLCCHAGYKNVQCACHPEKGCGMEGKSVRMKKNHDAYNVRKELIKDFASLKNSVICEAEDQKIEYVK